MKNKLFAFLVCCFILLSAGFNVVAEVVPADAGPLPSYFESSDGQFFYPFNSEGDWSKKLSIANGDWVSFAQTDGINNSGMLELKPYAGLSPITSGVNSITMQEEQNLTIRGEIRYANYDKLVSSKCYVECYLTGLKGAPLYSDAACTVSAGEAAGGFVKANVQTDENGKAFGDGAWHTFTLSFPTKGAKHSTGNYIDLTGHTVNLWFRPYNGDAFSATTSYFTQEYLDECAQTGETPYVDVLLDDFEGYFSSNTDTGGYQNDGKTIFNPFGASDTRDTTAFVGSNANRAFQEEYLGQKGVVTLKNEIGSVDTPVWNITATEGKKLRVSGDIALMNAKDLTTENVNVNALLILNGGSTNSPAGFYEDEACTIPCESVSGNAICHSATILEGISSDGWVHFSQDFDTTTVYKSSIKRVSTDSTKKTVYIKPWEVTRISVWFRVANGGVNTSTISVNSKIFTDEYLINCGYMLENETTTWVADPDKTQTNPYLQYALDNFSIKSVQDGEIYPEDFCVTAADISKTENIFAGDTINVSYTITDGYTEGNSRAYVMLDGRIVAAGKTQGAFSFTVPREAYGKSLSFQILPAAGTIYAKEAYTADLGSVGGALRELKAETAGDDTLNWSCDVLGDVPSSQIIAALYDKSGALLKCTVTPVAAAEFSNGIVAEGTISDPKAQTGKVMMWDSVSALKPLAAPKTVRFAEINDDPFAGDDEINVVFLGGSITHGEKAVDKENDSFAGLTSKWLKETYGENKTVNCYNAGVSGTPSNYGLLRLNRDVISKNPDLVFVEFAVNDGTRDSRYDMESIVRSLAECETNPYIVFLYTTGRTYSTEPTYHKQVASLYEIPQISLRDALKNHLNGQDAKEAGYFADDVHPTEAGHKVYFEAIRDALATGRYFSRPVVSDTKLVEKSGPIQTSIIDPASDAVTKSGEWKTGIKNGKSYVSTIWEGETLQFEFDGSILAVEHALNEGSGQYKVYVDGKLMGTGDPYWARVTWDMLALGYYTFDLEPGHHTCKIETAASTNENSTGSQVMLYNIITGGSTEQ